VDGEVGINRDVKDGTDAQWLQATTNTPVSAGDRIYARDNSRASVAVNGRNFARLNPRTALDVMYLTDDRTQLALRDGSALFDVGRLPSGGLFEVATPQGAFDFDQPGLYEVGINDNGSAFVSVLNGLARVVGLAGTGRVGRGEMLTLLGQTAADIVLSRFDRGYAGGLLNDYYGYRYPQIYDGRYANYDAYLNDPFYYDPYNRYTSYRYVSDVIPGVEDLDYYGDWQDVSGYGYCWHPRVDAGWVPYQQGYWAVEDPYGQPHYVGAQPVVPQQIVNINVPGALTVVPVQNFNSVITERTVVRVDPNTLAQVRPVLDPLTVDALRRAAMQNASARRKVEVPTDVARRIENTRVYASAAPSAPPFRPNIAQALRVEAVPEKQKRE